jgi:hypothetical protein
VVLTIEVICFLTICNQLNRFAYHKDAVRELFVLGAHVLCVCSVVGPCAGEAQPLDYICSVVGPCVGEAQPLDYMCTPTLRIN